MMFEEVEIAALRDAVKTKMSEKRFIHTLGVERMARRLGEFILPDKISELAAAALLHDIAKEIPYDEQVRLLAASSVKYTHEDTDTKPALHSIAALPVIERDFPSYATENIMSAVANHTLGQAEMSVFDEIIFISDYAEAGRSYSSCKQVREYLINNINSTNTYEENIFSLHKAVLDSINFTVSSLTQRGDKIHTQTIITKTHFEELLKNS